MKGHRVLLLGVFLITAAGNSSRAQETSSDTGVAVCKGMDRLNHSMQDILVELRAMQRGQQSELLMRRLELKSRELAPMEQALRDSMNERSGFTQELRMIETRIDDLDVRLGEETPRVLDRTDNPLHREKSELELRLRFLRDSLGTVEQRILELESDLARARRDSRALEELVDKQLGILR